MINAGKLFKDVNAEVVISYPVKIDRIQLLGKLQRVLKRV